MCLERRILWNLRLSNERRTITFPPLQQRKLRLVPSQEVAHSGLDVLFFFFFNFFAYFICLDCTGSWLVHWAFPSCGKQGLCFLAVLSFLNVVASRCRDSRACRLQWLQCTGLVTPQHEGSSGTRDQTCVPYVDRWILNHWTTRVKNPAFD